MGYRRTLPGVAQQSGDGQADGGDIGDDQQAQQQHQQEGDDLFDQLSEGDVADAAGHEQVDTHRRGDEADGQVDHHDQAEVDDVHAEVGYHGVQDGGQDEDGGVGLQQAATGEEQHVDDHQHDDLVVGEAEHGGGDHVGDLLQGEYAAQDGAGAHDDVHGAVGAGSVSKLGVQGLQVQFFVDEQAHQQGIHHGDHGGLGGGEDTAVDAAQDDNGGENGPESILEVGGHLGPAELLAVAGEAVFLAGEHGSDDEQQAQDDAGHKAAHEHGGDGGVHGNAVGNHGDAGGDDDTQTAGGCHQGHGELLVIALFHHGGDHDSAHSGCSGRPGAGDGTEEHAGDDGDDGQTAGEVAHQRVKEQHQPLGQAAALHQGPGQDEEGNGHQGEGVAGGEQAGGDVSHVHRPGGQGIGHHGQADGEADGHRGKHAQQEHDKNDHCTHQTAPPSVPFVPLHS